MGKKFNSNSNKPRSTSQGRSKSNARGRRVYTRDGEDNVKNTVSKRRGESRDELEVNHKFNDVSWYSKNQRMLEDSASFSYNNPLGNQMPFAKMFPTAANNISQYAASIPGLYSLRYVPTIGLSISSTSPANLAAQNIYAFVRYMNSGAKNYDPADIMMYLLTMDSVYMMWNWAKRIYGYSKLYSQKNRYLPKVMAFADSVDLDSVVANLADFRYQLNALASRISSFCVPAVMPLFIRHSWMTSNIYKDSDNDKAQMYMFTPDVYYMYDETSSKYGGVLTATQVSRNIGGDLYSYKDIIAIITAMLDAIAYSEDIGVMSGDILKAYGQDKLFKISPVEADYVVEPVYNEEVLNQIHNSRMSPILSDLTQLNITQDPNTGFLIWNPTLAKDVMQVGAVMVNMPWDSVTPENTMVATRLTSMQNADDKFIAVGSEFIDGRFLFEQTPTGGYRRLEIGNYLEVSYTVSGNTVSMPQNSLSGVLTAASMISQFDWHPLMAVTAINTTETIGQYAMFGMFGDVTNYTIIDDYSMSNLHQAALLSEFNVPQIGSF